MRSINAFSSRLAPAVHDFVKEFNSSGKPTDAVVKVAVAHGFNREQTRRLGEKANTLLAVSQLAASGADPEKRAAEHSLVDISSAVDAVAGWERGGEKAAADLSFYAIPPAFRVATFASEKVASDGSGGGSLDQFIAGRASPEREVDLLRPLTVGIACAQAEVKNAENDIRDFTYERDRAAQALKFAMSALDAEGLSRVATELPAELRDAFTPGVALDRRLIRTLKSAEEVVCNDIRGLAEISGHLAVLARDLEQKRAAILDAETLLDELAGVKTAQAVGIDPEQTQLIIDMVTRTVGEQQKKKQAPAPKTEQPKAPGSGARADAPTLDDPRARITGFKNVLERYIPGFVEESERNLGKAQQDIDRGHTELLVNELLIEDPVISQASPGDIQRAVGVLRNVSPHIMRDKETARSAIRQQLQSDGMAALDAAALRKYDVDTTRHEQIKKNPALASKLDDKDSSGGSTKGKAR